MQTRSFLRDKAGKRSFWEVTWEGPEVEIATGKLGTQGKCAEHCFRSPDERDAFIAKQITAATKRGFVEVETAEIGTPEPEPDPSETLPQAALDRVARLRRPAFVPETTDGDGPSTVSKFSGRPWLAADEPWPSLDGLDEDLREATRDWLGDAERPRSGDKIGGWPHWIQGSQAPRCPNTPAACRVVAQIDTNDHLPVSFGDSGIAFVSVCPKHRDHMTMSWQCC